MINHTCDLPGTLAKTTLELVQKYPGGLMKLSQATEVPFYWLVKFAAGKIPNPSVNRVQYLYQELTGKPLL